MTLLEQQELADLLADTREMLIQTDGLILRIVKALAEPEYNTLVDQLASRQESVRWIRVNGKFQLADS